MRVITVLLVLLYSNLTRALDVQVEQQRLDAATELWEAQTSEQGYTFTVQTICYCTPEYTQDLTVDVSPNGDITSVKDKFEFRVEDEVANTVNTVWDLFFDIQDGIDRPAATISVTYDESLGYPVSLFVDWDDRYADEDRNIEIKYLTTTSRTSQSAS